MLQTQAGGNFVTKIMYKNWLYLLSEANKLKNLPVFVAGVRAQSIVVLFSDFPSLFYFSETDIHKDPIAASESGYFIAES